MENHIGKVCPYCHTPIKPDSVIYVCTSCDIPHHEDCWAENGGCSTYGCKGIGKKVKPVKRDSSQNEKGAGGRDPTRLKLDKVSAYRTDHPLEPFVLFLKTFFRLLAVVMVFTFILLQLIYDIRIKIYYYGLAIVFFVISFYTDKLFGDE
jgi:hypothetical protein